MPDLDSQILTQLGGLDAKVDELKTQMTLVCNFKDEVGKIAAEFVRYKEARKDLPDRLAKVEILASNTEREVTTHGTIIKWLQDKVVASDIYLKAALIAWGVVVSAVGLLIALGKYFGITFVVN